MQHHAGRRAAACGEPRRARKACDASTSATASAPWRATCSPKELPRSTISRTTAGGIAMQRRRRRAGGRDSRGRRRHPRALRRLPTRGSDRTGTPGPAASPTTLVKDGRPDRGPRHRNSMPAAGRPSATLEQEPAVEASLIAHRQPQRAGAGHGGRLQLRPQQVQPRHAGASGSSARCSRACCLPPPSTRATRPHRSSTTRPSATKSVPNQPNSYRTDQLRR